MESTQYKTKYIDEVVTNLRSHFPKEPLEHVRKRAVNIFNRSHTFSKKDGYVLRNTVGASSVDTAVKLYVIGEKLAVDAKKAAVRYDRLDDHRVVFTTNVSLAAIDMAKLDIQMPNGLTGSSKLNDVFEKRDDLLLLDLILVVEGTNLNKDTFTADELTRAYKTIVGMPLTAEHGLRDIQGTFYDAQLIDIDAVQPDGQTLKRKAVQTQAVFYKSRFPDEADVVIGRALQGNLRFSMECYFESAACSICNKDFTSVWDYCDHLWDRFEPDSATSRVLNGIKFVGGSYVRFPAEKNAVLLDFKDYSSESLAAAAASRNKPVYHHTVDDAHFAWTDESRVCASNSIENEEGETSMDFETLLAKFPDEIDKLVKAKVEQLMAEMDSKSEKDELEQQIAELTSTNEALKAEKDQLEKQITERAALDRAMGFVSALEHEGVDLGTDDEKNKLVALFLKLDDADAETTMAFLRKTKAQAQESSSESQTQTENSEQTSTEQTEASTQQTQTETETETTGLPLTGNESAARRAVASQYGTRLSGQAFAGLTAIAEAFEKESK